jgi:tetratricopeptide (TPR) repeat protein
VIGIWALDEQLPELLIAIAEKHRDPFERSGELGYLLAESYARLGQQEKAEELALQASQRIGPATEQERQLARRNGMQDTAFSRYRIARYLEGRGLFDWAEREYREALEEKSDRFDSDIRVAFAQFYWLGGSNIKAADVLRPIAESIESTEVPSQRSIAAYQRMARLASYYFYQGLADLDADELEAARESLRKAYELDSSNPDVVIAMKRAAKTQAYREFYESCFDEMQELFRGIVVDLEKELVFAGERDDRRRAENALATACNQLAWLLGKCETNVEEAIRLGRRAIELRPDESAYLDTLGRCYFSAGDLENALKYQREAVRLSPHERQMAAQLAEFEAAAVTESEAAAH